MKMILVSTVIALFTLFAYTNYTYLGDVRRLDAAFLRAEETARKGVDSWVIYLEGRLNRVAATQDRHRAETYLQIQDLEIQIKKLKSEVEKLKESRNK